MKRKCRSPAEEQQEACGIWLDTLALKNRKISKTSIAKPTLRMQNRLLLYPTPEKVPLFTKQTTISTYFRSQPVEVAVLVITWLGSGDLLLFKLSCDPNASGELVQSLAINRKDLEGEMKANTNTGLSSTASKSNHNMQGHKSLEGERSLLTASSFPPLQELKHVQHHTHRTTAQSNSRRMDQTKGGKCTSGDHDLDQHLEANGVLEPPAVSRPPLRDNLYSQTSQNLKFLRRNRSRPSYSNSCLSDSSNSENTDPQLEKSSAAMKLKGFNQNMTGMPLETITAPCISDKGPNNSQLRCTASLFSQDSEGRRVISHCFSGEQSNLSLPKQTLWDKSNRGISLASRDCFRACFPEESGPQLPAGAEISLNSCYDLLFTEDSEGNRVIKH